MKGHWIWTVIGCGLPLLLIFFAPALGIKGYNGFFAFIILMFLFHLLMPHGSHRHRGHKHDSQKESDEKTIEKHKEHQHH